MLKLREVSDKDCMLIWECSNDPDVRAVSFSQEPIPYKDHVKWFKSKLNDMGCYFYIAEDINQRLLARYVMTYKVKRQQF